MNFIWRPRETQGKKEINRHREERSDAAISVPIPR
jgi:hypothetical protein